MSRAARAALLLAFFLAVGWPLASQEIKEPPTHPSGCLRRGIQPSASPEAPPVELRGPKLSVGGPRGRSVRRRRFLAFASRLTACAGPGVDEGEDQPARASTQFPSRDNSSRMAFTTASWMAWSCSKLLGSSPFAATSGGPGSQSSTSAPFSAPRVRRPRQRTRNGERLPQRHGSRQRGQAGDRMPRCPSWTLRGRSLERSARTSRDATRWCSSSHRSPRTFELAKPGHEIARFTLAFPQPAHPQRLATGDLRLRPASGRRGTAMTQAASLRLEPGDWRATTAAASKRSRARIGPPPCESSWRPSGAAALRRRGRSGGRPFRTLPSLPSARHLLPQPGALRRSDGRLRNRRAIQGRGGEPPRPREPETFRRFAEEARQAADSAETISGSPKRAGERRGICDARAPRVGSRTRWRRSVRPSPPPRRRGRFGGSRTPAAHPRRRSREPRCRDQDRPPDFRRALACGSGTLRGGGRPLPAGPRPRSEHGAGESSRRGASEAERAASGHREKATLDQPGSAGSQDAWPTTTSSIQRWLASRPSSR